MDATRYWILIVLAGLSFALVGLNMVLVGGNRGLQTDVSNRNLYIQQSLQLENLYQSFLRALAELSVRHNDPQLTALLAAQGITVSVNAAPQPLAIPAEPDGQAEESPR